MRSDEADVWLHERLVAGDDDALAEAYDRFSGLVYSLAVDITGDRGAAEDVTQDVFVHLWERAQAYDPQRGALRSWLCLVARSRALDWTRRRQVRPRNDASASAASAATAAGMDEPGRWKAETAVVWQAVQALPEPQREAVLLAFYGGHTYREVAGELKIPEGTAKSRLRLALASVAHRLAAEGIIER